MAVKASSTITLSFMVDIKAVYRYYKLQSSTASKPSVPTSYPPSGWTDSEPSYTSGSTNTLYLVDCTVFTNNTYLYSAVSKSSAYEAAKEAYNKAQAAQDSVDGMPDYIGSRGENLVTNGTAMLQNNTNFSTLVYDGSDAYYSGGCFKGTGILHERFSDEFISIDVNEAYKFSYYIKCSDLNVKHYDLLASYDIDKKMIRAFNTMFTKGSTTTLAKELKNGDTKVYLTNVSGFNKTSTASHQRGLIFWNYKNSQGYQYPIETYSQNVWYDLWDDSSKAINDTENSITLRTAWDKGTFPIGTSVSQSRSGSGYVYGNSNFSVDNEWTKKEAIFSGIGWDGSTNPRAFRYGTAFIKIGWLLNYSNANSSTVVKLTNIQFTKNIGLSESESKFEEVQDNIDDVQNNVNTGLESLNTDVLARLDIVNNQISMLSENFENLVIDETGASMMTQNGDSWVFSMGSFQENIETVQGALDALNNSSELTDAEIENIKSQLESLLDLNSYVKINLEGEHPVIELGNDSAFKVLITNESIDFMNGDIRMAYINNDALKIRKAEVEDELIFGGFAWKERPNGNMGLIWKG